MWSKYIIISYFKPHALKILNNNFEDDKENKDDTIKERYLYNLNLVGWKTTIFIYNIRNVFYSFYIILIGSSINF